MKNQMPPFRNPAEKAAGQSANRITIVLRPGEGQTLESIRQFAMVGAPVAIGCGSAVIASLAEDDAVERMDLLDNPASTVHVAICMLEIAGEHAEQDGRATTAEGCTKIANELRQRLGIPKPGGELGLDFIQSIQPGAEARERGRELLLAIEKVARRVIEREAAPGGIIALAIAGGQA